MGFFFAAWIFFAFFIIMNSAPEPAPKNITHKITVINGETEKVYWATKPPLHTETTVTFTNEDGLEISVPDKSAIVEEIKR